MANHFRSSERQGNEKPEPLSQAPATPDQTQDTGSMDPASRVDEIVREETAAEASHLASHAAPRAASEAGDGSDEPQPVTTVTASAAPDASDAQATGQEGIVVSKDAGDVTAQPETKSVFAPLQDDGNRVVPHTGRPTISLRNATLIYPAQPNKPALDQVSLDIYPGEFVFVVGHSGSGKSTLLKLITRELRATSGKVIVAGQDLTKLRDRKVPYLRRQIGTVYQDFKLLPDKTVYENVAFALECIGKPRAVIKVQVPETLRLVGLAEKMDNYPDQLSGGEQQRVSVARAMVNRPPLLVCDEPTGNLDPAISLGIMRLLDRINRTGTTVVMATHDREMVDSMRRRVIALEAGHVVRDQERGGYGFYGAI